MTTQKLPETDNSNYNNLYYYSQNAVMIGGGLIIAAGMYKIVKWSLLPYSLPYNLILTSASLTFNLGRNAITSLINNPLSTITSVFTATHLAKIISDLQFNYLENIDYYQNTDFSQILYNYGNKYYYHPINYLYQNYGPSLISYSPVIILPGILALGLELGEGGLEAGIGFDNFFGPDPLYAGWIWVNSYYKLGKFLAKTVYHQPVKSFIAANILKISYDYLKDDSNYFNKDNLVNITWDYVKGNLKLAFIPVYWLIHVPPLIIKKIIETTPLKLLIESIYSWLFGVNEEDITANFFDSEGKILLKYLTLVSQAHFEEAITFAKEKEIDINKPGNYVSPYAYISPAHHILIKALSTSSKYNRLEDYQRLTEIIKFLCRSEVNLQLKSEQGYDLVDTIIASHYGEGLIAEIANYDSLYRLQYPLKFSAHYFEFIENRYSAAQKILIKNSLNRLFGKYSEIIPLTQVTSKPQLDTEIKEEEPQKLEATIIPPLNIGGKNFPKPKSALEIITNQFDCENSRFNYLKNCQELKLTINELYQHLFFRPALNIIAAYLSSPQKKVINFNLNNRFIYYNEYFDLENAASAREKIYFAGDLLFNASQTIALRDTFLPYYDEESKTAFHLAFEKTKINIANLVELPNLKNYTIYGDQKYAFLHEANLNLFAAENINGKKIKFVRSKFFKYFLEILPEDENDPDLLPKLTEILLKIAVPFILENPANNYRSFANEEEITIYTPLINYYKEFITTKKIEWINFLAEASNNFINCNQDNYCEFLGEINLQLLEEMPN